jgi:hypothetical protein
MKKRNKRLLIIGVLLLVSAVILGLGLKYFPFTKVVKMPAGSEKEFANPQKIRSLSPHTLYYDFEIAPGKDMPGGFYKGQAHSGQYSVKAFGQNSFSVAVERTAGEIGIENLKAVALSAWIYVFPTDKEVKGNFVFTASNEVGVNVCWQGIGIVEPEVPRGKWFKISKYFDLTTVPFKPEYKIQVYFWNNSSTDILIDDYFISFGGPVDRRGDSARVDMTRPEGFTPKFNQPPFPVTFLERETLAKPIAPNEIGASDFILAGDFMNAGNDGLLAISREGRPVLFAFCAGLREFRRITLLNTSVLTSIAPVTGVMKGKFIPGQPEQFLVTGKKGRMLCTVSPPENVCGKTGPWQATLKVAWKSNTPPPLTVAGDFNGDQLTELLEVAGNGQWKVLRFDPAGKPSGNWNVLASDASNPVPGWNTGGDQISLSAGKFATGLPHDAVLTVGKSKTGGKYIYSLRKLNVAAGKWTPVVAEGADQSGMTIGTDTLKPADLFFEVAGKGQKPVLFRYNRDWRYDLKEIRFSDTTFAIRSAIDFQGYDKDQNPKYYESLKLVAGNFLDRETVSVVAVGHVAKQRQYQAILPDFVHLYTLPATK